MMTISVLIIDSIRQAVASLQYSQVQRLRQCEAGISRCAEHYSVSHDLRAPLRSVHSYSPTVQEEYGEKLDTNGRRIANTVIKNALKMERLIDDLLDFSHVGRSILRRGRVNMHNLVESVFAVVDQKKHDTLQVYGHTLPPAVADVRLIRQVWVNLISNAMDTAAGKNFPKHGLVLLRPARRSYIQSVIMA